MWALVRHFRHYPSIFRRMSRKSECDYRMSLKTPENASTTWPSSGKMLPWRRGVGSFLALAAFVAVVTLTIANHDVRRARRPSRVALASYTGEHLTSFFRGLRPVPAYVNGKIYPPNR